MATSELSDKSLKNSNKAATVGLSSGRFCQHLHISLYICFVQKRGFSRYLNCTSGFWITKQAFSMTSASFRSPYGECLANENISHRVTPKLQTSVVVVNFP